MNIVQQGTEYSGCNAPSLGVTIKVWCTVPASSWPWAGRLGAVRGRRVAYRPLCQGLPNVSCTNLMSNARVIKEESCRIKCVFVVHCGIGIWLQLSNERDLCSGDQWPLWPRSTGSSPMSLYSLLVFAPQLATFLKLNNFIIEPMELIAEISRFT